MAYIPSLCEDKTFVPGDGPLSASLLIIGESPGTRENESGKPFWGPSGGKLRKHLALAGLTREEVRLEYVFPYQPPGNKISTIPLSDRIPYANALLELIGQMPNLRVVVPLGNAALDLVRTGQAREWKRVARAGISAWRGSVLDGPKEGTLTIPTIHPADLFRQPLLEKGVYQDWKRIGKVLREGGQPRPERWHNIHPRVSDLETFLASLLPTDLVAVDIERLKWESHTSVVGFAKSPRESLVIPTTEDFWGKVQLHTKVLPLCGRILSHPCPKGGQNFLFDRFWLKEDFGFDVANALYDSRWMHHALDPTDRHSLDYLVSMYTDEPYYKEEGKVFIKSKSKASLTNLEAFWIYNGLDCTTTREIFPQLEEELRKKDLWRFYLNSYADLYDPLFEMMRGGILVDPEKMGKLHQEFRAEVETKQKELEGIAQRSLTGKKDLSGKKLKEWMYGEKVEGNLGLVKERARDTGKLSVNSLSIRKLMGYHPEFQQAGQLMLDIRSASKSAQSLTENRIDIDNRFRSTYSPSTITGRLASAKNPRGTGSNAQNIDRTLRSIFLPDLGHIFLEIDLSQAEDRVVKALTGDPELLKLANLLPGELDVHSDNAEFIFRTERRLHPKSEWKRLRQIGKTIIHAGNYDQGAKTLRETLLEEGEEFTLKECKSLIERAQDRLPQVVDWRRLTRIEINNLRELDNPFGRKISFRWHRMDDATFRCGYAWRPQGTVGEIMNRWGVIPTHHWLKENPCGRICAQVHDSILVSIQPDRAYDLAVALANSLEKPLTYRGVGPRRNESYSLTIPAEFKLGRNWGDQVEFKRLPSRKEFTECAQSLRNV